MTVQQNPKEQIEEQYRKISGIFKRGEKFNPSDPNHIKQAREDLLSAVGVYVPNLNPDGTPADLKEKVISELMKNTSAKSVGDAAKAIDKLADQKTKDIEKSFKKPENFDSLLIESIRKDLKTLGRPISDINPDGSKKDFEQVKKETIDQFRIYKTLKGDEGKDHEFVPKLALQAADKRFGDELEAKKAAALKEAEAKAAAERIAAAKAREAYFAANYKTIHADLVTLGFVKGPVKSPAETMKEFDRVKALGGAGNLTDVQFAEALHSKALEESSKNKAPANKKPPAKKPGRKADAGSIPEFESEHIIAVINEFTVPEGVIASAAGVDTQALRLEDAKQVAVAGVRLNEDGREAHADTAGSKPPAQSKGAKGIV